MDYYIKELITSTIYDKKRKNFSLGNNMAIYGVVIEANSNDKALQMSAI